MMRQKFYLLADLFTDGWFLHFYEYVRMIYEIWIRGEGKTVGKTAINWNGHEPKKEYLYHDICTIH